MSLLSLQQRSPVIGVSLKMYFDPVTSVQWSRRVAEIARKHPATAGGAIRLFVLPSLPALFQVSEELAGSPVEFGAQDLFWEDRGPFTGGVSGSDLRALGCSLVEIGHVERRLHFGETDGMVNRKLAAAIRNGLTPVLCVGERVEQDARSAADECVGQLESAVYGLTGGPDGTPIVVAYEPEWAIGVDKAADPDHVNQVAGAIRNYLDAKDGLAGSSIIYGGSAQPGVLPYLDESVDGLFLGRFAHDPDALRLILDETMALR